MADLRPFRALRPAPERAECVAAPPYDVIGTAEARALSAGRPESILHVTRPEIALPDGAPPEQVHAQGRLALDRLVRRGVLRLDATPTFSVYRQHRPGTPEPGQTGVAGLVPVAGYRDGSVAVHEHTRRDKEDDRAAHLAALDAHDEPVFLMYRDVPAIDDLVGQVTAGPPDVAVTDADGVEHTLWIVAEDAAVKDLASAFSAVPRLYIADGHHRSAAAARLAAQYPDRDGARAFPVVAFPAGQLTVLPYHRLFRGPLPGELPLGALLPRALEEHFTVEQGQGDPPAPDRHQFVLLTPGSGWFRLTARPGAVDETDPIGRLDVALLQSAVLEPLLGVHDPRTDPRLDFAGGTIGLDGLAHLVVSGGYSLAIALHPTSPSEVMEVADRGLVMPPKSTWFDPKLASGLFVHPLG